MGVNAEIVVTFETQAEAAGEAAKLAPVFRELFADMLKPEARGCALVVSGLVRYMTLDPTASDWGKNLDQWPTVGLAIRILGFRYGLELERVRYGNDHIDLDAFPYDTWPAVRLSELAFMDDA